MSTQRRVHHRGPNGAVGQASIQDLAQLCPAAIVIIVVKNWTFWEDWKATTWNNSTDMYMEQI